MQMTYRRDGDGDIREKQFDEVVDLRNTIGILEITGDKNSLGLKALDWVTPGQRVSRPKTLQGGTHVAVVCMVNELFLVSLP
jgi:hypothetical protein